MHSNLRMTAGDSNELRCILAAEEQRLQGELLDASDDVAGSAAEKLTLLNQVLRANSSEDLSRFV